jgi:dinuclear metal center YbgI/SA1388 family protein
MAVYSPHTAFDNTQGGINDILCRRLGLTNVLPLRLAVGPSSNYQGGAGGAKQCKIVVFLPEKDLGKVSAALFSEGAGAIGEYTQCSFRVGGCGTFFGSEQANPTLGQKGQREEVPELRLEVVCPASRVVPAVRAMRAAHSYEEPAFDVYPVQSLTAVGRQGTLPKPETLKAFARRVQHALKASHVQVVGGATHRLRRAAIACGAGGELLSESLRVRADVFLTGELRFHDQLAAESNGLAIVLPGHYATERPGVEELAERLGKQFGSIKSWASKREAEPTWML